MDDWYSNSNGGGGNHVADNNNNNSDNQQLFRSQLFEHHRQQQQQQQRGSILLSTASTASSTSLNHLANGHNTVQPSSRPSSVQKLIDMLHENTRNQAAGRAASNGPPSSSSTSGQMNDSFATVGGGALNGGPTPTTTTPTSWNRPQPQADQGQQSQQMIMAAIVQHQQQRQQQDQQQRPFQQQQNTNDTNNALPISSSSSSSEHNMIAQQQQIQNFLKTHGHRLTQQLQMSLQQQLVALQQRQQQQDSMYGVGGRDSMSMGGTTNHNLVMQGRGPGGRGGADGMGMNPNFNDLLTSNTNVGGVTIGVGGGTTTPAVLPNSQQQPGGGLGQSWGVGGDGGGGGATMGNMAMHQREQLQHLQSMINSTPAPMSSQNDMNTQLNSMHGQLQVSAMAQHQQQRQQQQQMMMVMQDNQARQLELIRQMQHQNQMSGDGEGGQLPQIMTNPVVGTMGGQPLGILPYQQSLQQGGNTGGDDVRRSSLLVQQQQRQQQLMMENMNNPSLSTSPMPAVSSRDSGGSNPAFSWQLQKQSNQGRGIMQDTQQNQQDSYNMLQQRQQPSAKWPTTVSASPYPSSARNGETVNTAAAMRVVPVSISPPRFGMGEKVEKGYGVSDAVLIYTKFALQSIITSLNQFSGDSGCLGIKSGESSNSRAHTVRDLSTCIGAWDLKVPATMSSINSNSFPNGSIPGGKRLKGEGGSSTESMNDGNADTAFRYYYERSCPILLNPKRPLRSSSSPAPLPYCVEDFGDAWERKMAGGVGREGGLVGELGDGGNEGGDGDGDQLPVLAGAIVLKYGSDSKFTGGIGEEGVMTKAIVEFFYPGVEVTDGTDCGKVGGLVDGTDGLKGEGMGNQLPKPGVMINAEEQFFTSVDVTGGDQESSSLVKAALYALSPTVPTVVKSTSSSDDGVYIPTIWSGNTNRTYQYCLLDNVDNDGNEFKSKRFCVAVQEKTRDECDGHSGPAKGVCRITLTLSPASVLTKKQLMVKKTLDDADGEDNNESTIDVDNSTMLSTGSGIHRLIRTSLRVLRPPKLTTKSDDTGMAPTSVFAQRRKSVTQIIDPKLIVVGVRCQHELLLDPVEAGKIYINGALAIDCSSSMSGMNYLGADALSTHMLFGVDFTLPVSGKDSISSSGLPPKMLIEKEYGALLVDALIDAAQSDCNVAGKLLGRLITGNDFDDDVVSSSWANTSKDLCIGSPSFAENSNSLSSDNVGQPCMESIVLSSSIIDPIGIGAKALGTKFRLQYGEEASPCEVGTNEEHMLHQILGAQKLPKAVPHRARAVLLRGGYLRIDKMASSLWVKAAGERRTSMSTSDDSHADVKERAVSLLRKAGCKDAKVDNILFVDRQQLEPGVSKPFEFKLRCWYDPSSGIYYASDAILFIGERHEGSGNEFDGHSSEPTAETSSTPSKLPMEDEKAALLSIDENVSGAESNVVSTVDEQISLDNDGKNEEDAKDVCGKNTGGANERSKDDVAVGKEDNMSDREDVPDDNIGVEEKASNEPVADRVSNSTSTGNGEYMTATASAPAVSSETMNDLPNRTPDGRELDNEEKEENYPRATTDDAAYLLAFYIAKEHPDGTMLERFVTSCHHS